MAQQPEGPTQREMDDACLAYAGALQLLDGVVASHGTVHLVRKMDPSDPYFSRLRQLCNANPIRDHCRRSRRAAQYGERSGRGDRKQLIFSLLPCDGTEDANQ